MSRTITLQVPDALYDQVQKAVQASASSVEAVVLDTLSLAFQGADTIEMDQLLGVDPETGALVPQFNPRFQAWSEHFRWSTSGTKVMGMTAIGRATVSRLRMNRESIVKARERWILAGWFPSNQS